MDPSDAIKFDQSGLFTPIDTTGNLHSKQTWEKPLGNRDRRYVETTLF